MSETFKASNGWYIDEDGRVFVAHGVLISYPVHTAQLRLLFQELRDAELGRWRDTVEPHIVCYSRGRDYVRVASESSGQYWEFKRDEIDGYSNSERVARAYFTAHPVHKPLPEAIGLYVNAADMREFPHSTCVLTNDYMGWHIYGEPETDAESMAQRWHDVGELVRLVPEGSDDE